MFKKSEEINFFELFIKSADYTIKASNGLLDLVKNYSNIERKVSNIKEIEHQADNHAHTIYKELNKAFITPIEREDILSLNQKLDDVIDDIEHISRMFFIFDVKSLEPNVIPFVEIVVRICLSLKDTMLEFKNFKKSKILIEKIIAINNIEEEGDRFYAESVRKLFISGKSDLHITKWFEIYENLENCIDHCEQVANIMEDVILKNT